MQPNTGTNKTETANRKNLGRIGTQHPKVGGHPIQQSQPQAQIPPSFPQFPNCANDVLHQVAFKIIYFKN